MTDLDRLWETFPTSKPPVSELLRRGSGLSPRPSRRPAQRLLIAVGTVSAVAGAFALGVQVGGGSGDGAPAFQQAGIRPAAFMADLHPAASCDQLLASYRDRGAALVGPYGWGGSIGPTLEGRVSQPGSIAAPLAADAPPQASVGNSATGTNVQEVGVDEPDIAKTDGKLLARIDDATLTFYDVTGNSVRQVGELTLKDFAGGEILLVGTNVVALGRDTVTPAGAAQPGSRVAVVSVANPTQPTLTSNTSYSSRISSARQHGAAVRLVLSAGPPALNFVQPGSARTANDALATNREAVRKSGLGDWIPSYDDGHGRHQLIDCGNVALPPQGTALGTVSIVGFDPSAPFTRDAIGLAGLTDLAFESADHLYLTSSPVSGCLNGRPCQPEPGIASSDGIVAAPLYVPFATTTTLFQFDLDGFRSTHVASGQVAGSIASRWSMDEAGGILRVAVTQRGQTSQVSAVVTFRRDGTHLVENGRLDGLGAGETLTAARWFDNLVVLSTAKQTDPLYTVDLTDPAHPKLLGSLHIPGFTEYFHPIGGGKLLGVGQSGALDRRTWQPQSQVGLFDISDLTNVRQLAVAAVPGSASPVAAHDPRAFSWFSDRGQAFTAFAMGDGTVVVGRFDVGGSNLTLTVIPVPGASAQTPVRTMELPDRRVVLVAGANVSFV